MESFLMNKIFLAGCLADVTACIPTQEHTTETRPNIVDLC